MRNIVRIAVFTIVSFISIGLYVSPTSAEFVFKKDGRIIEGKIISDKNSTIIVRRANTRINETIRRSDILRIIYTELYLGKVFIRMSNGEVREGYIVDEDTKQYTVRSDITKAAEYTIPRAKVMFIARSNPTDLIGSATYSEMTLRWVEPFVPGKKYRVYSRENSSSTFQMVSELTKNSVTIGNLRGNTTYILYVTAVDAVGIESVPSEQIQVSTLNTPPRAPRGIKKKADHKDVILTWPPVEDIDGVVKEYTVSKKSVSGEFIPLGSSREPAFRLMNRDIGEENTVRIIAVDNAGASSDPTFFSFSKDKTTETIEKDDREITIVNESQTQFGNALFGEKRLFITVKPASVYPLGIMGKVYNHGYGELLSFNTQNLVFSNSHFGLDFGVIRFTGRKSIVKEMIMVPAMAFAGYRFMMGSSLSVSPTVAAGGVFISTKYTDAAYQDKRENGFEAAARISMSVEYMCTPTVYLSFGAGFTSIYEKSGIQKFADINAGAGFRVL